MIEEIDFHVPGLAIADVYPAEPLGMVDKLLLVGQVL